MYDAPSPVHGYFPVIVAFWGYVALVLAATIGARVLGAPDPVVLVVLVVAGLVLFRAFVPVFRRLLP